MRSINRLLLLRYTITAEFDGERIVKICQHLLKLWARIECTGFCFWYIWLLLLHVVDWAVRQFDMWLLLILQQMVSCWTSVWMECMILPACYRNCVFVCIYICCSTMKLNSPDFCATVCCWLPSYWSSVLSGTFYMKSVACCWIILGNTVTTLGGSCVHW